MANNRTAKHEARRSAQEDRRQEAKRIGKLEREVKELTRTTPIDPAQAANMAAMAREARPGEGRGDFLRVKPGNANFSDPIALDIARLKGRIRNDIVSDRDRGAASPLSGKQRRR